jgi:DNA-binding LytR/AlgR family response regulator
MIKLPASYYNYNHQLPFEWQDVLLLEGSGNYTVFVLFDGSKHISTKSLGNYEAFLPSDFVRVHKGHIVNRRAVVAVCPNPSRKNCILQLRSGQDIPISKRRLKEVLAYFENGKIKCTPSKFDMSANCTYFLRVIEVEKVNM